MRDAREVLLWLLLVELLAADRDEELRLCAALTFELLLLLDDLALLPVLLVLLAGVACLALVVDDDLFTALLVVLREV